MTPYAEAVLAAVDRIPRGRVAAYSDIAEWMGRGTGRTVGTVMSRWGSLTCWHRVLRADGSCAEVTRLRQLELLRREGIAVINGRIDLDAHRWDGT